MRTGRTRVSHIRNADVFDELAKVLLFQADQLAATASRPIAEAFIGFELQEDRRVFAEAG